MIALSVIGIIVTIAKSSNYFSVAPSTAEQPTHLTSDTDNAVAIKELADTNPASNIKQEETVEEPATGDRMNVKVARIEGPLARIDGPATSTSYQCFDRDYSDELVCGDFSDPNWIQLLDDETLFQLGMTDPYAAYLAAGRLTTIDPGRSFEYALRSVALSGRVTALQGDRQPKDGTEVTDEVIAELNWHTALRSKLYTDILENAGHDRSAAAPELYWDQYIAANPGKEEALHEELLSLKRWMNAERQKIMGDVLFADVSP